MTAYYNEFDPYAAAWLRNLISAGLIAPGDVDERSISDVRPDDLRGYTQCHWFAGIGVWSYALRRAGWPDERPVWTGSCPCQPFSAAGKGAGFADERHLWPHFHWLIEQCRPAVIIGEQVSSKDGLEWFDLVQADLEGAGYACAAVDTCAAGFGAPHIRQRLYWVADANDARLEGWRQSECGRAAERTAGSSGVAGGLADACGSSGQFERPQQRGDTAQSGQQAPRGNDTGRRYGLGGLADADGSAGGQGSEIAGGRDQRSDAVERTGPSRDGRDGGPSPTNGFWRDADWLFCRDGKWRPVEPGTFPLAHGAPARVGRLRAYGNAIVAQAAQGFIEAYLETEARRIRLSPPSGMTHDNDLQDVFA